ncbi:hypothetical protein MC885_017250 [Smutsia gigantea]|nr:hypothetical protein MC885_017250 [Smutsia gigantea]
MERGGEEGERVARLGEKVRIGVLTDRENVQGEEKARSQERPRSEGKASSEERFRGKKSIFKEKGRGHKKGRGEEQNWEDPLAKDKGKGAVGSSYVATCPKMSAAGPVWPRLQVLRALWALLAVLLAPWRLWAIEDSQKCSWQVVLNKFQTVGKNLKSDRFFYQEPLGTVDSVFSQLVDSPIDLDKEYLGFPYYLKINYSCEGESSEALVRKGYLTGLKPVVLVTFQSPVNFHHWKIEKLQIQMEAAPFRSKAEPCNAEVCIMSWYTPMPIKNGSVVMYVDVSSNGLGPFIPNQRFQVNINGFLQRTRDDTLQFTVGNEVRGPRELARPLWYTEEQAPVLILGGIPEEKSILLTDTSFRDFFLVELSMDSCWVGSFYCPQASFTATIYDAIATESTLFIRQNQLVYYFTGTYITLHEGNHGSGSWVRVLANECIKKLCPVHFHSNGSEYIMALTTGKHEGYVHFGTITDGRVSFELLPRRWSVCEGIQGTQLPVGSAEVVICSITWATFIADDYNLLLLVEIEDSSTKKYFQVVSYDLVSDYLAVLYTIPEFIPDARDLEFLMILGTESYTNHPMVPTGMSYNPYKNLLFIWGNFLLLSYNTENYIYLAGFPKEQSIKYLVNSYHGDVAVVTETEEIWYLVEGSYQVHKLLPSKGWEVHISLQVMHQSSLHAPNETMVTLFYEDSKLYQLVYLMKYKKSWLVKRLVPVEQLLIYQKLSSGHLLERQGGHPTLSFTNLCPFTVMRLQDLPNPQTYTRQELYRAPPPHVLEPSGFHHEDSLAVYQGLLHYLLWLHSKYDKAGTGDRKGSGNAASLGTPLRPFSRCRWSLQPYADPVHDSTWRWWKNKKQDQDYYFYLASNRRSTGNIHIDMASYEKIYDLKARDELPERIFLDKGTSYSFSIFLTARGHSYQAEPGREGSTYQLRSQVDLGVVLADPDCVKVVVKEKAFVNRNSLLFRVTLSDKRFCFDQGISGHHLMKTSILVKVVGSAGHCFQDTHQGPRMQGNLMVPVLIGCPPGKRLAFDTTYTLEYNRLKNKQYFDCVHVDPEIPCFLFRDIFYPFFLIQDLVTGDSGRFQGSYVLKVVGGGPTLDTIREYSEEEIYRFNSPLDKTDSLIWATKNATTTEDSVFNIMSNQSLGIEWLCLENSPCHDTVPHSFFAPEFFFKVLVSNRGVDESTYCDYQFIFLLHIHGLPLSAKRALFIFWKIDNIIISESYRTHTSPSKAFSSPSGTESGSNPSVSSHGISTVAKEKVAGCI